MITVEVEGKEEYMKPLIEFMDKMYKMGGHVSIVHYHEYIFDQLKPILKEMTEFDKEYLADMINNHDT